MKTNIHRSGSEFFAGRPHAGKLAHFARPGISMCLNLAFGAAMTLLFALSLPGIASAQKSGLNTKSKGSRALSANAEKGKRLYATLACKDCHGSEGQGAAAPRVVPPAGALSDFVGYVRKPAGWMPPYNSEKASDSELADIYAFLKSEAPSPASSASSEAAPTGNVEKGKQLYAAYGCYECHGYQGQGSVQGARLAPNPIPLTAFTAYVRSPSGEMPPYTQKVISDQDLADIHAFLKSLPQPPNVKNIPLLHIKP